jgi:hypothetical protein
MKLSINEGATKTALKCVVAGALVLGAHGLAAPPLQADDSCCPSDPLGCSLACIDLGLGNYCVGCNDTQWICEFSSGQVPACVS